MATARLLLAEARLRRAPTVGMRGLLLATGASLPSVAPSRMIATLEADILFRVLAFGIGADHVALAECCTRMRSCLLETQGQAAYQRLSIQVQAYMLYAALFFPLLFIHLLS